MPKPAFLANLHCLKWDGVDLARLKMPGIKAKPLGQRLPVPAGWRFC